MAKSMCLVDDKYVPLYRILWVAAVPHFCGDEECTAEGMYEVRLDQDESVFGTQGERDTVVAALEAWGRRMLPPGETEDDDWSA